MSKEKKLGKIIKNWIKENEVTCAESIYQCDRVQENMYELVEKLCKVVGYHSIEE